MTSLSDVMGVFENESITSVLHFASKSIVSESVQKPGYYYKTNLLAALNLIEAMGAAQVKELIFSSSAAVFGNPLTDTIDESHPECPINPYGWSKYFIERILADSSIAHGLNVVCLRYFNAAGADPSAEIGEAHANETHLIPRVLVGALEKADAAFALYGSDYPTADGTCIRDYVHVNDLARAHLLALEFLGTNPGFHRFNLGSGRGYSVLEVLRACESVTGVEIPFAVHDRRAGDPARLVASSNKARDVLDWTIEYDDIEGIVETAWNWHRSYARRISPP